MEDKLEQRSMGVRGEVNLFGLEEDRGSFMEKEYQSCAPSSRVEFWRGSVEAEAFQGRGTSMCWGSEVYELCSISWA